MTSPPEDFIGEVNKADAAEAARQAAITSPPRPRRRTNRSALDAYVQRAIDDESAALAGMSPDSGRNDQLNTSAFNLGTLIGAGALDRPRAESELENAARQCGMQHDRKDGGGPAALKTLRSGIEAGIKTPRDISNVGQEPVHVCKNGKTPHEEATRILRMIRLSGVKSRVPMWVWEYDGIGRIQLGTLTMFAGKPGAGKSTAARWFAARLSKGELPGVWHGHPMNVAVIMAEEQTDAVVVPSLIAADADMERIYTPRFIDNGQESVFRAQADEQQITEYLLANEIRALFIDPIMSTMSGKTDAYRNNEVREILAPFTRIAKAINGIVVGITHLRKGEVRDVIDCIHSSSAFSEVPRAVFGFAPIGDGNNIFEQVKNSAGPMGLRLTYHLSICNVETDDGQSINLPCFKITGETELSIADISGQSEDQDAVTSSADVEWLRHYLMVEQPAPSARIKQDAKNQADISESRLHRARKHLRVRITNHATPDKPHQTAWSLPVGAGDLSPD